MTTGMQFLLGLGTMYKELKPDNIDAISIA